MKLIRTIAMAVVCFSSVAPAQKIATQYDRATDFSAFKTYKWITIQGATPPNQITAQNIVSIVDTLLAQKGLALTSAGNADLLVGYQTSVHQQTQVNWFNDGGPWMGGMGQASTSIIDVGTLVIDMYDPARKQLIWRGSATKTLNPSGNADKNYEHLQKAVEKLLKNFPPKEKN
jgi:Domain of unknown function (DUF4136)